MKISVAKVKNVIASTQDLGKAIPEDSGLTYSFFPFTIILGDVNTTETGYKDNYSIPNDYTSFAKVFTGAEAILAVWDESFSLTPSDAIKNQTKGDESNVADYYYTKEFKVGDSFKGIWISDHLSLDFTASAQNSGFTQQQVVKQISLNIRNNDQNKRFIENITNNIFKLYAIPEFNAIEIEDVKEDTLLHKGRNPYNKRYDRQWYYISGITKVWNTQKQIAYATVEFTSLNDKLANSGFAINQYVQQGAPGEPFPYPRIENDTIILDEEFLTPLPVTHAQVTLYGSGSPASFILMGREYNEETIYEPGKFKIDSPSLLFPFTFQAPIYDNLSLKAVATNNYFVVKSEIVIDTYFQNWRDNLAQAQLFDETNTKSFEGHVRSTKTESETTNKPQGQYYSFWDDRFLADTDTSIISAKQDFNVAYSPYFNYQNTTGNTTIINHTTTKGLGAFFLKNYFMTNTTYQVPLNVRETTPVTLNSLPVVGWFANKLFCGVPVGFKIATSSLPNNVNFYILWSAAIYKNYSDTLYKDSSAQSIIPFNAFDNGSDSLAALVGTNSQTTSFSFNFTNRIKAKKYNIGSKTPIGDLETISTRALAQPQLDKTIYLLDNDMELQKAPTNITGYFIDSFGMQGYYKGTYKIEFFSNPHQVAEPLDERYAVWVGTYTTFSELTKNTRLWSELKQLSNPNYMFDKSSPYPTNISYPIPPEANSYSSKVFTQIATPPDSNKVSTSTIITGHNHPSGHFDNDTDAKYYIFHNGYDLENVPEPLPGFEIDNVKFIRFNDLIEINKPFFIQVSNYDGFNNNDQYRQGFLTTARKNSNTEWNYALSLSNNFNGSIINMVGELVVRVTNITHTQISIDTNFKYSGDWSTSDLYTVGYSFGLDTNLNKETNPLFVTSFSYQVNYKRIKNK